MRWLKALLPLAPYVVGIFFFSSRSSFPVSLPDVPGLDKLIHATEYALLGLLVTRALRMLTRLSGRRAALIAFSFGALYGATDEWHQAYVPGRDSSVWDWSADSIGSAVGVVAWLLVERRAKATAPKEVVP